MILPINQLNMIILGIVISIFQLSEIGKKVNFDQNKYQLEVKSITEEVDLITEISRYYSP
ncbi:hypothetical protein Aazo_4284 ['Nostoc azollae' 0708]|jgi:hypothetical protein|uniref:Uncharacterized protein n=1 Tax=Nostoc azollae (strain 0708) TaxID=551115 RepID=D7DWI8_NOSA0|nr:hypothetical protein Aazo_4284 ['Nostoc azollae' 0708]